jgi:hypothetical protein
VKYLIVIAVEGKPAAVDRLVERIDWLVEDVTIQGGIDSLTTEVVSGRDVAAVLLRLKETDSREQS